MHKIVKDLLAIKKKYKSFSKQALLLPTLNINLYEDHYKLGSWQYYSGFELLH
jgi:hypothetical protein